MKPANLATRAVAVVIDGLVTFVGLGALVGALTGQLHRGDGSVGFNLHGAPALIWVIGTFAYWIGFECLTGTTPAKRLFGLRVIGPDGAKPTAIQAVVRNLLRIVDGFPFLIPYLLGLFVALTSADRQRIGDRLAGTRVVSSP